MAHHYSKEKLDEDFEQFMKESLSDDSFESSKKIQRRNRKRDLKKKNSMPWWLTDDDLEDDGALGTSVSFLKSQKASQPVVEMEEAAGKANPCKSSGNSVISRDSLETNDSVIASGPNLGILGLDTLEEQEEKERFFAKLEKGLTSTIDYSKLNEELDSNESTQFKDLLRNKTKMESTEDGNEDDSKPEEIENYSDDFEDEGDDVLSPTEKGGNQCKQNPKSSEEINAPGKKEEKTGMLANVVLLDSLDSIAEVELEHEDKRLTKFQTQPEVTDNEMTGTGMSYGQSNSDLEALRQAYHHIDQSLGDTDEPKLEGSKNLVQDIPQEMDEGSKNISTPESDLQTVEELMKPIRLESSLGNRFGGQPVSMKKPIDSKTTEFVNPLPLKKQPPVMSEEQEHLEQFFEKNENIFLQKTTNKISESSLPRVTPTEEHIDKMQLNVLRKKLSQDSSPLLHDSEMNQAIRHQFPQLSSGEDDLSAIINKQATYKKTRSAPPLLKRKSQSGPYASVRSSGYGKSYSPLKTFSAAEKKTSKDAMKKENIKSKSPPYKIRQKGTLFATKLIRSGAAGKPVTKTESYLNTPNKSLANDPKYQVPPEIDSHELCQDDSILCPVGNQGRELYWLKRVEEAEEKWNSAQAVIEQVKATFSEKEQDLKNKMEEMKKQQEKELFRVNQDNYLLQAKLNSFEETNKKLKWFNAEGKAGSISEEKLKQIQKEIQEQETLLQGYQQENERLYKQVKELQVQNKKNEERLFKENQCLLTELSSLKEQLQKSSFPSRVVQEAEPNKNQSFTELLTELRTTLKEKNRLLEEIKILKQDKQALEVDLEKMKKERDLAKDQIIYASGEKSHEIKLIEESHKQEISRLQKRLQWYAENQELLDKDAVRLREANEEIEKLKLQVEKLKTEAGNQSAQQKSRLKDRAADAKKIQDLERQVKEMEGILKRRYPNSLPALILAASAAGDTDFSSKTTVEFMEKRIKKLEADLEGKDEEAKKSLRTMEQQFQKIKIQYEQRMMELEQQLTHKLTDEQKKREDSASMKALEQELCDIREAHQITIKSLESEIENLKIQNAQLELKKNEREDKDFQSLEFQVEQAHTKARLVRLNQELAAKEREIQDLTKTVEKLQKERRLMLSNQNSADKPGSEERTAKKVKKDLLVSGKRNVESFPETLDTKLYEPHTFADFHISEVLQENSRLKNELEQLTSEMNEQRAKSEAVVAHSESTVKRTKEDATEHIAALKASHQREIEKLLCQHALENSSSKVAELNRKISTQEVLIKHLQTQVTELQDNKESLAISQVREEILQKEISKLLEELREAKESHTPEMKHFMGLERKIKHMEMRHVQREQELQQIIQQTRQVVETEQEKEVEKWKRLAQLKNQELEKFRVELDSILDVLRELHRQGVVVPVPFSDGLNVPEY